MRSVCVLLILLALASCTSTHIITGTVRPAIDPSAVKVYSHPPPQYEEVALLTASSRGSWAFTSQQKMNEVVDDLKKEAAKLGANGVLVSGLGSEQTPVLAYDASGKQTYYGNAHHKTGQAVAIYVKGEEGAR